MTTINVYGSANSQNVNLMNLTQNVGKASTSNFKDYLNTGKEELSKSTEQPAKSENPKAREEVADTKSESPTKETVKATEKDTSAVEQRKTTQKDVDNVRDAIEKVVDYIEEKFNVTDDEIIAALETLGLTVVALLDTDKMPEIITELTGSEDTMILATDENLFSKLNEVTELVENVKEELVTKEGLNPAEFGEALKQAETLKPSENLIIPDNDKAEKTATLEDKITVTVSKESSYSKASNEIVKETDSAYETTNTTEKTVTLTENLKNSSKNADSRPDGNETFSFNLLTKTVEAMNEADSVVTYSAHDVENIINQLTEAIKVDITPETSEINLRLHPESLGNVSVRVVANHEGVLTAEFTAQNEGVKAIIESQAVVLREALEAKGVTVEAVEVLVQSHEFERNLDGERQNGSQNEASKKRGLRRINLSDELMTEQISEEDSLVKEMMAQSGNTVDYSA